MSLEKSATDSKGVHAAAVGTGLSPNARLYFYLASLGHIHLPSYPCTLLHVERNCSTLFVSPPVAKSITDETKRALRCAAI